MNNKEEINKVFEGLMPKITDLLNNRNYTITAKQKGPRELEFSVDLTKDMIDQIVMMLNISNLFDGKKE